MWITSSNAVEAGLSYPELTPEAAMRKLPVLSEKVAADPARAMRGAGFDPEAARYELRDSDGRSAVRGLGMVVQKSGHRTWVLRYEIAGRPYKLTLVPGIRAE